MSRRKSSARARSYSRSNPRLKRFGFFLVKRIKLLFVSLGLVLAAFIVFAFIYLFQYFRVNLTQASSGAFLSANNLDIGHDFNLLLFKVEDFKNPTSAITALAVLNFQVQKNKLLVLEISPEESVANIYSAGRLPISALYGLSSLSQGKSDSKFSLEKTLSFQLGLPIDGLFYTDEEGYKSLEGDLGLAGDFSSQGHGFFTNFLKSVKILPQLGSGFKTNLDLASLLSLSKFLVLNFPPSLEALPVNKIGENLEKFDALLKARFVNQEILEERQTVIILNGTRIGGLATSLGRLTSNLGLSVLSTGNTHSSEIYSQSFMIAKNPKSYTTSRLEKIFGIEDIRNPASVENDPGFSRLLRADIVLVSGLDQIK